MWPMTEDGFLSIVEKPTDRGNDTLTVRARDYESLRRFCRVAGVPVKEIVSKDAWPSDYPYRVVATRDAVEQWAVQKVRDITYSNFKNRATVSRGKQYHDMLSVIWGTTHRLTPEKIKTEMRKAWKVYDASWRKSLGNKAGTIISSHWGDDEPLAPEEEEKLVSLHDLTTAEWDELMKDAP